MAYRITFKVRPHAKKYAAEHTGVLEGATQVGPLTFETDERPPESRLAQIEEIS